jgi:hypothetical protein
MIAELLQIGFLAGSVLALSYWAERPAKRKHEANCDICARRNR